MRKVFIRTKNVKRFVSLMEELKTLPNNMQKIALVFGDHGLGKSQTIQWWADKNDSVYVRAVKGMSTRWLLSEIAEEIGKEPHWHSKETFELIEDYLRKNQKTIIIDEADYLVEKNSIETLRDLHDRTGCPIVIVGMGSIDRKLSKYPHLCDRIYKSYRFEAFDIVDIREIIEQITDLKFSDSALEFISLRINQFRQLIKLINRIEKLSKTNDFEIVDEYVLKEILNERKSIKALQTTQQLLVG